MPTTFYFASTMETLLYNLECTPYSYPQNSTSLARPFQAFFALVSRACSWQIAAGDCDFCTRFAGESPVSHLEKKMQRVRRCESFGTGCVYHALHLPLTLHERRSLPSQLHREILGYTPATLRLHNSSHCRRVTLHNHSITRSWCTTPKKISQMTSMWCRSWFPQRLAIPVLPLLRYLFVFCGMCPSHTARCSPQARHKSYIDT